MTSGSDPFQLNGRTQIVPMLGDPIGQVKAPAGLTPVLQGRGLNALVIPWHVQANALQSTLETLRLVHNVPGVVLTLPHKLEAYSLCADISPRCRIIGAVNVLRKTETGDWYGDHTDGIGYLNGLCLRGFNPLNCKALVIGAGGAGSAIAWELLEQGADKVALYDVDARKTEALIERLEAAFPGKVMLGSRITRGYDLLANASPAGMQIDDPFPVEIADIEPWQFLADAITEPSITPFLKHGMNLGCGTMTGADMFNGQAEALADILYPATILQQNNA